MHDAANHHIIQVWYIGCPKNTDSSVGPDICSTSWYRLSKASCTIRASGDSRCSTWWMPNATIILLYHGRHLRCYSCTLCALSNNCCQQVDLALRVVNCYRCLLQLRIQPHSEDHVFLFYIQRFCSRHAAPAGWTPKLFSSRWISRFKVDKFFIFYFFSDGGQAEEDLYYCKLPRLHPGKKLGRQQVPGNWNSILRHLVFFLVVLIFVGMMICIYVDWFLMWIL